MADGLGEEKMYFFSVLLIWSAEIHEGYSSLPVDGWERYGRNVYSCK